MQIFIGGNGNITGGYDGPEACPINHAFGMIHLGGVLGHSLPENFENLDPWKHIFLDFGTNLNTVNTDKQISHNKASVN